MVNRCRNDVVRRRGYSDHFVMLCVGVYVSTIKRKLPDLNDLKLGTVVVLDSVGSKGQG